MWLRACTVMRVCYYASDLLLKLHLLAALMTVFDLFAVVLEDAGCGKDVEK